MSARTVSLSVVLSLLPTLVGVGRIQFLAVVGLRPLVPRGRLQYSATWPS